VSQGAEHANVSAARRIVRWVVVVGSEAGALALIVTGGRRPWRHIDWTDLGMWIRITPAEDAIVAVTWLAVCGCVIWVAATSLLYLAARASRIPVLIRSAQWMTLPAIRKLTERACGAILVTATMTAVPVRADLPTPLMPPWLGEQVVETSRSPADRLESNGPPLPVIPHTTTPHDHAALPVAVTVRAGDSLWTICRRHLMSALGDRPSSEEIAPYWRQVIAHNRPHLISGNPDLIYAGEIIAMPPIS